MKAQRTQTLELGDVEHGVLFGPPSASSQDVTVVYTNEEGTLAALKAAGDLTRRLAGRLILVVPVIVPRQHELERPLVPTEFLEQIALRLVSESGIRGEAVRIQIWLCRDRKKCLKQILGLRSLVVMGGRWHWWLKDEWRLEKWLAQQGHQVIFADVKAKSDTEMLPKAHREPLVFRAVKNPEKRGVAQ
jgi:hypothetical protein